MIQELIDQKLLQAQEEKAKKERSGLWAPGRFGRCYRFQYWSRKKEIETNPPDITALRRFKVGSVFHDYIQKFYPQELTEIEVKQDDIIGYLDVEQHSFVIDIKTVKEWEYKHICKEDFNVEEDKEPNCMQVCTYAWLRNKPNAILCFVNIASLESKEFILNVAEWIPKIQEELAILRGFWEKEVVPPAIPRAYGGKECSYCSYRDKCNKFEGKEV